MKSLWILMPVTMIVCCACSYKYEYTYKATNYSKKEVIVELITAHGGEERTVIIPSLETKILIVTDHGSEGAKGPYDTGPQLESLIIRQDTVVSKIPDYQRNWTYDNGTYSTNIFNSEF